MSKEHDQPPARRYFTQEEAEAKVGKRIRTLVAWSGVPEGTIGAVVAATLAGWSRKYGRPAEETYDVAIQWDLPRPLLFAAHLVGEDGVARLHIQTGRALTDWFTKDEYEQYLEELPDESDTPQQPPEA